MKGQRGPKTKTYRQQHAPAAKHFKVPEYGPFKTREEAEAAAKIASAAAAKLGFKSTVSVIEVSDKVAE